MSNPAHSDELSEQINFAVISYRKYFGKFPNCAIASDQTIKYLGKNQGLRDGGEEKGAYAGLKLRTDYNTEVRIYRYGRLKAEDLRHLENKATKKTQNLRKVTSLNLILTKETSLIKRIFLVDRFQKPLFCDLSLPFPRFQEKIKKQTRST